VKDRALPEPQQAERWPARPTLLPRPGQYPEHGGFIDRDIRLDVAQLERLAVAAGKSGHLDHQAVAIDPEAQAVDALRICLRLGTISIV
jgi:hypothetical protein